MITALCTFLALLSAPTLGQDSQVLAQPSPCPTVFTYDPPGPEPGWWSGVLNLSTDFVLHSLWLDIVLDSQALKLVFRMAEANTQDFKSFRIEEEDMQIQPRIQTSLRFSVEYDTNNRVPRLQAIRVNGIVICNALLAEREKDSKLKTNINTKKRPIINPSNENPVNPPVNPVSPRPDNKPDPGNKGRCPTVFTYDPPGPEPGWWSGVINLSTDFVLHSLWLDIVLDSQALKLVFRMAEANTQDFKSFRIEEEDMQIQPRIQTSLRFSVQYDTNNRVPRLQAIRVNGIVICNALLAERETDSKLKTNINTKKRPIINPSKENPVNPVSPRPDNKPDPGNNSNASERISGPSGQQTQCGTSTWIRQWPWVAAVYRTYNMSYVYVCGGSLVSHRHVITAAQCVTAAAYPSQTIINENNLVVYLGKQNLNSVLGVQIRLVQEILVSPSYIQTQTGFMHDVALLVLHEPLKYTDLVRPVCLWPANEIDLDNVIEKKGVLVGWAYDEKNEVIDQLSDVEMPVVSQEACIESQDFVNYDLTNTDSTYCAGNRQDTVLCKSVDTGNGLFFKMGDSWYLRGHVTSFLHRPLNTEYTCDPTHYILFTDVAKSVPWIHGIVSKYL